jgi:flagellar biosynthesis GTPase FlhF
MATKALRKHIHQFTMPLSDDESSYSSCEDSDSSDESTPDALGSFLEKDKKKSALAHFDGFEDDDEDDDNSVAEKMKSMLELRKSLGMDNDAEFMRELSAKEEEKKRLASMTVEERMQYEESKAGDVMSKIRARHAEKQKELDAKRKEEEKQAAIERERLEAEAAQQALIQEQKDRIERECKEEEERRKEDKRVKKKAKEEKLAASADSATVKKVRLLTFYLSNLGCRGLSTFSF